MIFRESNITNDEAKFLFSSSSRGKVWSWYPKQRFPLQQTDSLKEHLKRTINYSKAGFDLTTVLGKEKMDSMKTPFQKIDVGEEQEEEMQVEIERLKTEEEKMVKKNSWL